MLRSKTVNGIIWLILALGLHVWPGLVGPAHGQGTRKDDIVFNTRGIPLAGATVRVCAMPATGQPCTPLALIYSDPLLTQALANPTTTDGMGNYFFYAAPGRYEIEISGPSITTKQIPNVILPSDPSAPTFNSLSTTGGINAFTLNLSGNLTVNGSTTVVGNLASGTLNLTNQGTAPGAAGAGTVNLYTKTADKRLYYKDETGTEVGPIASSSGAQTNQPNTFTAPQNVDADFHTRGPNPAWDVTRFGGYIGPNYSSPTTGSISGGSAALTLAVASDFANGHGVLILGAGAAPIIPTPQAPSVTPIAQTGSTPLSYCVVDTDWANGRTPCSAVGSNSTGLAAFGLQSYTISGWSTTNGLVTITTSTPHNIPTTKYNGGYPQIEVPQGSVGNAYCEGAWTAVAVPSSTTVQFTRYGVPDSIMNGCSGGTLRVLPRVALKWDSHYTYSVTNAACSVGTATLTINPGIYGPNGTWAVPWQVKAVIAGVSDSHYNTTTQVGGWTGPNNTLNYSVVGGSCSGVATGNLGGTVSLVPGKAVKNHLIYRCTGSSCVLPTNAANYSLVGVAEGNDGYFVDNGTTVSAGSVDLGDAPSTPPATATNEYLSTTILSGGGTTALTLAASATNTVSVVKVFHDNAPNLLQACAAIPASSAAANGGHIIIPAPASGVGQFFPIAANFDMVGVVAQAPRNCPPNTTLDFRAQPWLLGTIMMGFGDNIISDQGATNCFAPFYGIGSSLNCAFGSSYPLLYFEPEQASNNYFQNMVFSVSGPYQSALFYDQQMNSDGVVGQRYDNVHVTGGAFSQPIVDKGGFGRFWNYGGWASGGTNFATSRTYTFTQNCGAPTYTVLSPNLGTYITETHGTYNNGTATVDSCGQAMGNWINAKFDNMLSEGLYGPAWLFNTYSYGMSDVTFINSGYADLNGGASTPFYDLTNTSANGFRLTDNECGNSTQTLLETNPTGAYGGVNITSAGASQCAYLGIQNYRYENQYNSLTIESNYNRQLLGNSQIFSPMSTPGNFQSVTQLGAGNVPVGTYSYCLTATDALGGETAYNLGACTTINVTGQASVVQFTLPATFPPGATGVNLYTNGYLAQANGCVKPQYTTPGGTYTYNYSYTCGAGAPTATTAAATALNTSTIAAPKILLNGEFTGSVARSEQNIFLPGALSTTWTASTWTPDKPVTVTRLQVQAKTAPAGCATNAVVRLTDGTTPMNLTITAAANDSGALTQNYAAGTPLTVSVQTAAAGCTTAPADANVTVQYRMQ